MQPEKSSKPAELHQKEHQDPMESPVMGSAPKAGPEQPVKTRWDAVTKFNLFLIVVVGGFLIYNQVLIGSFGASSSGSLLTGSGVFGGSGDTEISEINLAALKSTGHSVAVLFPVEDIASSQDAVDVMIPRGTPEYGTQLGVSFDDPTTSLSVLSAQVYPQMLRQIKTNQEAYQRYLNIVTKPVGVSCEYCCGIGPIGAREDGSSACGCQHNPALLGLTMWLIQNTDYSDREVIREALRWKALFFPKNMVELALSVAGGDTSSLENLPGMVGGC